MHLGKIWLEREQHANLLVKVDETLRAIDIVERRKAGHCAVDGHRMGPKFPPASQQDPVRVGPADENALVAGDVAEVAQLVSLDWRLFGPEKQSKENHV